MTDELVAVEIRFRWRSAGNVSVDEEGKLAFPILERRPGVYRFDLTGSEVEAVYVGEAEDLRRRMQHYRTPGSSQPTNLRMNARIVEHVTSGGSVQLAVVESGSLVTVSEPEPIDLHRKEGRLIIESAAVVLARKSGLHVENL